MNAHSLGLLGADDPSRLGPPIVCTMRCEVAPQKACDTAAICLPFADPRGRLHSVNRPWTVVPAP